MAAFKSLAIIALPFFVMSSTAVPTNGRNGPCNTGGLTCCQTTQSAASNPVLSALTGLLSPAGTITGMIGFNCTPLTGIGAGGTACTQQPVCCDNVHTSGLFAIGCSAGSIGL